ncbi:chromo-like protein [Gracilaria domingensis]|nr:chromo-like protein [Gracilaria domingensis]KAI0564347.1 chromo-like protein [Gracilaria domingensis]
MTASRDSNASTSDSDGDWLIDGTPAKLAGKRRRRSLQHPKKRRRTNSVLVGDETFRRARINSPTGGTVNYFEGDDLSEEEAAILAVKQAKKPKAGEGDGPYTDFAVCNVEFKIKWTDNSFRKYTWETWDILQTVKGAKKVSNFVKSVEDLRKHVLSHATPEDIEDLRPPLHLADAATWASLKTDVLEVATPSRDLTARQLLRHRHEGIHSLHASS